MTRLARSLALALLALAVLAAPSPAPTPPHDCGFMTVERERFNVKADQLRCARAREHTRRYLKGRGEPRGFSCDDFGSGTAIEFQCTKGRDVIFFAVRR